jgi:Bifunctional DNA primase/polymerase, N-terminal
MFGTNASALEAALYCAQKFGWHLFPVKPDKTPLTCRGFYDATDNPEILKGFWRQWPGAGLALRTGAESGVVAVDLDVRQNCDGRQSLRDLGVVWQANPVAAKNRNFKPDLIFTFEYESFK